MQVKISEELPIFIETLEIMGISYYFIPYGIVAYWTSDKVVVLKLPNQFLAAINETEKEFDTDKELTDWLMGDIFGFIK